MKKNYISPSVKILGFACSHILVGSDNLKLYQSDPNNNIVNPNDIL